MNGQLDILLEIKKFQNAMQGENGKIILDHLRKLCGQDKIIFSKDALELARNEGKREIFILLQNELNMDVNKILEKIQNTQQEVKNVLD
jgi:hypothetical protein